MERAAAVITGQTRLGFLLRQRSTVESLATPSNIIEMRHFSA